MSSDNQDVKRIDVKIEPVVTKEPVIPKDPAQDLKFLGVTKLGFLAIFITLLVILTSVTAIILGLRVAENQRQLSYICSTTHILDQLVVAAGSQIQQSFDDGSYARLVHAGILTPNNVKAARIALDKYNAAHLILKNNGACHK